ncbi:CAP domain-containing protein [Sphingomonas sp.]|uniref:CAP domain-containing protein n=1 Tax=Sphingomonas sp. TaxID=28214 RepID=UPI00286B62EA|nr:CAP domain-containing protein [Sphingomonas sp.]
MTKTRAILTFLATALAGVAPCLSASAIEPPQTMAARILAMHNQERAAVGAPPMVWDETLAQSAASYGPTLASLRQLRHSPRDTRPGQRENLAMGSSGHYDYQAMTGFWINEKRHFVPGQFPNVSRTGNWEDVAHYTQMIWKGTTHVGCALQRGGDLDYLICRYSPPGNADGRPVP